MKQKIVGVYDFGFEQVELVLREGVGGEFYTAPEKGKIPRFKIGADCDKWVDVVEVLLHESIEFAMARQHARYSPSDTMSFDHSRYLFIMTHPQFSDVCAKSAEFLAASMPDLARAWKGWRKNAK